MLVKTPGYQAFSKANPDQEKHSYIYITQAIPPAIPVRKITGYRYHHRKITKSGMSTLWAVDMLDDIFGSAENRCAEAPTTVKPAGFLAAVSDDKLPRSRMELHKMAR